MQGRFISFEGSDGAGKTSVMTTIQKELERELGREKVLYTREPGGNRISEQIRNVLFDSKNKEMDERTEALLFAAARRQHLVSEILPGLKEGKVILCDRYVDSSVAYQGAGRRIGEEEIWQINQFAIDGQLPDLTVYLDIDPKLGLERIAKHRSGEVNRLDEEQLSFYQTVRRSYLNLAANNPERLKVIDASQVLADVVNDVKKAINAKFNDLFAD